MFVNTTHTNKEELQLIDDLIGKSFGILEKIKRKGVGSKRMIVDEVSPRLSNVMSSFQDITYASIEMRPGGILIHFNSGRKSYAWAIPFYQLVIYKVNGSSIHSNGNFVHFKDTRHFKENKNFFKQLMQEKINYDERFSVPSMI